MDNRVSEDAHWLRQDVGPDGSHSHFQRDLPGKLKGSFEEILPLQLGGQYLKSSYTQLKVAKEQAEAGNLFPLAWFVLHVDVVGSDASHDGGFCALDVKEPVHASRGTVVGKDSRGRDVWSGTEVATVGTGWVETDDPGAGREGLKKYVHAGRGLMRQEPPQGWDDGTFQDYELVFKITLDADWIPAPGQWQSVLHIGNSNVQRLPGIWFHARGNGLHIRQSTRNRGVDMAAPAGGFAAGGTYEIKVVVEDALMTVSVDGVVVDTASLEPQAAVANAAVYVGNPWYAAAKVTLSDLCLREIVTSSKFFEETAVGGQHVYEDIVTTSVTTEVAVKRIVGWKRENRKLTLKNI